MCSSQAPCPAGGLGPVMEMLPSASWEGRSRPGSPELPPATSLTTALWTFHSVCEDHRGVRRPCRVSGLCLRVPLTSTVCTSFLGSSVALGHQETLTPAFQFRFSLPDLLTVPPELRLASFSLSGVTLPPALCARSTEVWGATNPSWVLPMRPSCHHNMGKAIQAAQAECPPDSRTVCQLFCTLDGSKASDP